MIFKDLINIITIKIIRNKKGIFYSLIMVICTILMITSLAFYYNFNKYTEDSTTKNIGFRTLSVSTTDELTDEIKSKLLNIKYVDDVYSSKYDISYMISDDFISDNLDGTVALTYGSQYSLPNNIIGNTLKSDDTGYAICPIDFYPDSSSNSNLAINSKYILNGYDLLNKTFTIKYYSYVLDIKNQSTTKNQEYTKTFKIIGLYDSSLVMNDNNQCYISYNDLKDIMDTQTPTISDSTSNAVVVGTASYYIIVNDINNINYVKEKLSNLGYSDISTKYYIDANMINTVLFVCSGIMAIALFAIILLTSLYIKKKIVNEKKDLGILRVSGYRKKDITAIYLSEITITNILMYILGTLIFLIIYLILKQTIFESILYRGITISLNLATFLITFIVIVGITYIITYLDLNKQLKQTIDSLLKSEE